MKIMSYIYIVFIVQYKTCLFVLKIEHADDNDKTDNHDNLDEVIDISLPPLSSMISTTSTVLATPSVSSTIMVNNFVNSASGQCSSIPQVIQSICFSIYIIIKLKIISSRSSDFAYSLFKIHL